jgi:hypothetical protein
MEGRPGELISAVYSAIVLFHAGYLELVPEGWHAFAGTAAAVALALVALANSALLQRFWPLSLAAALTALGAMLQLGIGIDLRDTVAWRALLPVNILLLYSAYARTQGKLFGRFDTNTFLYAGHALAMAAPIHYSDSRFVVSLFWGAIAVVSLVQAITHGNKVLGRSALLVFGAFAAKVLLFDLSESAPLVRIGCLVVLGVSMYVGGLLYQRVSESTKD